MRRSVLLPLLLSALSLTPHCARHRRGARAPRRLPPVALERPAPSAPLRAPELLEQLARTHRFSAGAPAQVTVTPDGSAVFFLRSGPRDTQRALYRYDVAARTEQRVLTVAELDGASDLALSPAERARRERLRLTARGFASFTLSPDGRRVLLPVGGRLYLYELEGRSSRVLQAAGTGVEDARFSPDGGRLALVREGNVYVLDLASNRLTALTTDGTEAMPYGTAEFIAQEEMDRMEGLWWSPDGQHLAVQRSDLRPVDRLLLADPAHPELSPAPTPYPRAGRPNAAVSLFLVPASGGALTPVRWNAEQFPYLARVYWPREAGLTILVQERRQRVEHLLSVNSAGATRTLLEERDDAWLELPDEGPAWLRAQGQFLWPTEQSGGWQLELRGAEATPRALAPPELSLRRLVHVDEEHGHAYVLASEEPSETHLYRLQLDPSRGAPEALTSGHLEVDARFAEHSLAHVRVVSRIDGPTTWEVVDGQGRSAGALRSEAEEPSVAPRPLVRTVGARSYRTVTVRPTDFDPHRRYPVLLSVYGGPGVRVVSSARNRYAQAQWFAEQGMVVVSIDGRGTPARGREWSRALLEHLGEVPLADQLEALDALGREDASLDLARVGISGWSYGGFLAGYAAQHAPGRFRAAVAGAPVTDWSLYDTHYTERFLGLPDASSAAYEANSLLASAPNLGAALLVAHGTADDNVHFANSLRWVDALHRGGHEVSFLTLEGSTHMVADPDRALSLNQAIARFLLAHL